MWCKLLLCHAGGELAGESFKLPHTIEDVKLFPYSGDHCRHPCHPQQLGLITCSTFPAHMTLTTWRALLLAAGDASFQACTCTDTRRCTATSSSSASALA